MFRFEQEMIPVLEEAFSRRYTKAKSVREFNSGNGISDLTMIEIGNAEPELTIYDYAEMYYLVHFFNEIHKDIIIEELVDEYQLDNKTLSRLISKLMNADFILERGKNQYVVKKLYKPILKNVISFEAKLRKWKDGFFQAMRYKCFSHKSYLALPDACIEKIDVNMLQEYNIGLVAVTNKDIKIIFEPEPELPNDLTSYYHLSENLYLAAMDDY